MLLCYSEYTECKALFYVQSFELGPITPNPQASVAPPFRPNGGDTFACVGGNGGPDSDEATDTLVLYVLLYVYTVL